jgi:hypothetical protein
MGFFGLFHSLSAVFHPEEPPSWRPPLVHDADRFKPTVDDVLRVKESLGRISSFPLELVDTVIDLAEYWPHTSTTTTTSMIVRPGREEENQFIVSWINPFCLEESAFGASVVV